MSTDWYTKLVLTVVAVCAVALATRELRGDGNRGVEEGRYRLQVLPMGRMMLKIDSQTGMTWRTEFPEPKVWTPIADERIETLDDAGPAAAEDAEGELGGEGEGEGEDSIVAEPGAEATTEPAAPAGSAAP